MADRPSNSSSGDDEFDWVYGKNKRAGAPDPSQQHGYAPEESTRMMPSDPPGIYDPRAERQRGLPDPNEIAPTPEQPGQPGQPRRPGPPAPPGGGRPPRKRRRPRIITIIGLLILAWIAYLIVVPVITWGKVDKVEWEPEAQRPDSQSGHTYLMVGSDSRAGLSKEERKKLNTGGAEGSRTDTIMVMHTGSGPNLLMSIPRDSPVEIPGHGTTKINAAYAYGGPKLLTRTVEQATGIRIDTYVEIGMGGVAGVVDAVGGIEICPTEDMTDPQAGLDIKKGCQEADGVTALGYARSRKTSSYGDLDRAKHQREVVAAVGSKVLSPWTFINPVRYWNLNQAVPDLFTFGEGTGVVRAGLWAMAMTNPELTCGVPIADMSTRWDPERSQKMFDFIKDDATDDIPKQLCTPTGLPKNVTGG